VALEWSAANRRANAERVPATHSGWRQREHLDALHGFIKKTRATTDEDLALARKRKKELE
jgi:hypothetical protein